jgi:hypothetical protein
MSDDQIKCNNCGKLNAKTSRYCIDCGKLIEPTSIFPRETETVSGISSTKPPIMKKYQLLIKVLIFFGSVAIVDVILSFLVMSGFGLTGNSYGALFYGLFLLSMIMVGIFWGAVKYAGSATAETAAGCGAVVVAIILIGIIIPVYIINALAPLISSIATQIGNSINNALDNFFSQLFEDVEIPGFEPFLFIGLFIALSIFIVYKYHLKAKGKNLDK